MKEQMNNAWAIVADKLNGWFENIIINLPNFIIAMLTFGLAFWLSKNIQRYLESIFKRLIKQDSIRSLISKAASVLVIAIGLILALAILNLDGTLKSLLAGAGVAGLAISLALQGTLSNTFSGVFIALKNELNIGDFIETNGYAGEVIAVDLRNTKIKEVDNNVVVIPNKLILEKPFKNYGLTKTIRTTITCGVSYDSDLYLVEQVAISCIKRHFPENKNSEIEFYYTDFGDSSINFRLRFWVEGKRKLKALEVKSLAIKALKDDFDENDISIPYPTTTLVGLQSLN